MVCAKQMASLTDTQEGCNSVLSLWEDLLNLYFIFLLFPFYFVIQQGPSGVCMTSKRGHNKLTNIQSSEQNFNFNLTSSKCSPIKSLLLIKIFISVLSSLLVAVKVCGQGRALFSISQYPDYQLPNVLHIHISLVSVFEKK